ncbi:hypothetical protein AB0I61_26095 [Polymorphospora rubra]|uniref:hypothetical protein n=1 Tax=Polymorphospora rubra TaxID=338584 RepID=UPI0033D5D429
MGVLNLVYWLPSAAVWTGMWWAWRVPWVVALIAILLLLIVVFGTVEARSGHGDPGRASRTPDAPIPRIRTPTRPRTSSMPAPDIPISP